VQESNPKLKFIKRLNPLFKKRNFHRLNPVIAENVKPHKT